MNVCCAFHNAYQMIFYFFRKWLIDAYNHYKAIQNSNEAKDAGIQEVSGCMINCYYDLLEYVLKACYIYILFI